MSKPAVQHVEELLSSTPDIMPGGNNLTWPRMSLVAHLQNEIDLLSEEEFKAEEKKLVRKIDFRLMPALFLLICLNYLDRSALASARVQGIEKDLGLKHGQFNIAISCLIASGIQKGLKGAHGLEAWRWLFIIEGSMTIGVAILAIFILPDWPATTKWLTPRERALAVRRLAKDAGGIEDENGNVWKGARDALLDYKGMNIARSFQHHLLTSL
ncbi:hypothetical protein QFC19_008909 [Naganishia cerealis]|uniref:Uncharacterized protein n=1 Tax=Naganishia cerealis TaxID=610337 RepID=A0ACC2UXU0_9TREE|nr:hypothetical protein QFC19_008909 [Naganishia cerealis]